ncbi:MAG: hypothetical protein VB817_02170, partial [Pirellulaceae bacterium]
MRKREATAGWKKRIILVSLVIGLLAISLVIRQLATKPEQAQAQSPQAVPRPATQPARATAPSPTDPRTLAVVAVVNGEK